VLHDRSVPRDPVDVPRVVANFAPQLNHDRSGACGFLGGGWLRYDPGLTMALPIEVAGLNKTFRHGFFMRRVRAVKGITFQVEPGEIFGFLGPNGAGKTTTIKMLTALIAPTSGIARVFGHDVPSREAMRKVGFLPENPYVYPFLTPREFVEMCGRLSGLGGSNLRKRAAECLERVGITYAAERQVRRLSKGMLQRAGLAAALVAEPDLLILDEPMSGLDPVGRKEVRDLILEERKRGKTIFFSTHILSDVETLCDRVVILRQGEVVVSGKVRDLLRAEVRKTDVILEGASSELENKIAAEGLGGHREGELLLIDIEGDENVKKVLALAVAHGANVVEVLQRRETLENLFMRRAIGRDPAAPSTAPTTN
jgi:ABC-2 type transport system ATP-binding protein